MWGFMLLILSTSALNSEVRRRLLDGAADSVMTPRRSYVVVLLKQRSSSRCCAHLVLQGLVAWDPTRL